MLSSERIMGSMHLRWHEQAVWQRFCCMGLVLLLLTACESGASTPLPSHGKAPTPAIAGGEPVLSHSQIFFHNAPLPGSADVHANAEDWALPGYDSASTRAVPLARCCHTPVPRWFHAMGVPLLTAPVVSQKYVYLLASDGFLHALDVHTGDEQWRVPVGGEMTASGLALAHALLYVAVSGHYLVALNAENGQELWRFDTVGVVRAAPFVIGSEVFVASGANSLLCLDAFTGTEYWAFHSEDTLADFWPTDTAPAYGDKNVFVALGASNEFNALSLQTGRKVWEIALHERMTGGPVLDEGLALVYVVTWSGRVVALDMHTGAIRWDFHIANGSQSSPALSTHLGILYVGGYDGSFYGLDAQTGRVRWQAALGGSMTTAPLVIEAAAQSQVVAVTQNGMCQVLEASTGRQLDAWHLGELRAAPVIAQQVLYQASLGDLGLFAFAL